MKKQFDFFASRKIFFCISLGIILIGIVCNFIFGTTLDIQFKGGAIISYEYSGELDKNAFESLVQKATPDNTVSICRICSIFRRNNNKYRTSGINFKANQ